MRAAALKLNVVILDLKSSWIHPRPGDAVQPWILDVDDAPALEAHQVVMLLEVGVKTPGRTRMARPGGQTDLDESPQDSVDGHQGDLGEIVAHGPKHLLSRGMVGAFENGFENRAALDGDRQAMVAMGRKEAVHSLLFLRRVHVADEY